MKKTIYILFPIITYFLLHDLIQFVLYMGINVWAGSAEEVSMTMKNISPYMAAGVQIVSMLLAALFVRFLVSFARGKILFPEIDMNIDLQKIQNDSREHPKRNVPFKEKLQFTIMACLSFVLLALSLNSLILQCDYLRRFSGFSEVSDNQANTPLIMALFLFGFVSPLVEEYLFRYLLYGRMKQCFSVLLSMGLSALFFGLYHGNVIQGIYGFIMGLELAMMYEQATGMMVYPLIVPIICHGVANLLVYFLGWTDIFIQMPIFVSLLLLLLAVILCFFIDTEKPFTLKLIR